MQRLQIIKATPDDVSTLQKISSDTFYETFAYANTEADMQQYLEETFSKEKLQEELQHENIYYFLATEDEKVIGYLKLNTGTMQTEQLDAHTIEIERIYINSAHHGTGAGQQLLEQAFTFAREQQADYIWLAVWEHNPRAIRFYEKNDFVAFGTHPFILGQDVQTDLLMKKRL